jgi:beta-glucosidase
MLQKAYNTSPNTVIIIQAGMPTEMPKIERAKTLVYASYGGQETSHAMTPVLWGAVNPSGRLSLSLP